MIEKLTVFRLYCDVCQEMVKEEFIGYGDLLSYRINNEWSSWIKRDQFSVHGDVCPKCRKEGLGE